MGDTGLETLADRSADMNGSAQGGAESGALDRELAIVIDAWAVLSAHSRSIIFGIARKAIARRIN